MKERFNKPRVFLSHARRDVEFIERIESDLRKCQIEPWRDQNEIRDGQPWLSAIFEDGIPTCDAILAYYTDNSLGSEMVGKEVDSAILSRLSDSHIAFLPYVDKDETRAKLRVDIRTLQTRVWDANNYDRILPSVVSEIWRSFLERSINNAVLVERNRRLELELELQRLKEQQSASAFNNQEERDFQYIYAKLNRNLDCTIHVTVTVNDVKKEIREYKATIPLLEAIMSFATTWGSYDKNHFRYHLGENHKPTVSLEIGENEKYHVSYAVSEVFNFLSIYGLIDRETRAGTLGRAETVYPFSSKFERFRYWLEYNGMLVEDFTPIITGEVESGNG